MCPSTAEVDLLCRTFGRALVRDPIDGEVGDFIGGVPAGGTPQYTHVRYYAALARKGLAPLNRADLAERTSFRLDDLVAIGHCSLVGDAIG